MLSMMGNFTRPGWARARLLGQLVAQTARLRSSKTHSLDARPSRYGDAMQTIEGRRGGRGTWRQPSVNYFTQGRCKIMGASISAQRGT
jgi:hypothetical protein